MSQVSCGGEISVFDSLTMARSSIRNSDIPGSRFSGVSRESGFSGHSGHSGQSGGSGPTPRKASGNTSGHIRITGPLSLSSPLSQEALGDDSASKRESQASSSTPQAGTPVGEEPARGTTERPLSGISSSTLSSGIVGDLGGVSSFQSGGSSSLQADSRSNSAGTSIPRETSVS